MSLSNLIAQNFKANGTYDFCYQLKRKQKFYKMYKYQKNFKYFIKSRSNSSKKTEKQIFEAKTFIEIKL